MHHQIDTAQCVWCPSPKKAGTAVTCGAPDCKRLQRNARQLRLQHRHKAETGAFYSAKYPCRHDVHKTRRVVVACAVCAAPLDRLARHVGINGAPVCRLGPCWSFRRSGQWPRSEVPRSHPVRSTRIPDWHPARQRRSRNFKLSPATRAYVYARDGWRCRLCGKALRRNVAPRHPLSPSIDHIVPRSHGGSDQIVNLQAAHYRCNWLKADRLAGDQLALLG